MKIFTCLDIRLKWNIKLINVITITTTIIAVATEAVLHIFIYKVLIIKTRNQIKQIKEINVSPNKAQKCIKKNKIKIN